MRLIAAYVASVVITLAAFSGCSTGEDQTTDADQTSVTNVEVEFISREVTQEELRDMGLDWNVDEGVEPVQETRECHNHNLDLIAESCAFIERSGSRSEME